jgi:predicted ATP-dependent Lon-type protease
VDEADRHAKQERRTHRRRLLYLARLIPQVERTFDAVELGPRSTGKSFVFQQTSPYSQLVSSGQTPVAQLFVNLATGQRGLVALWDCVAFDDAAGIRFPDRSGINLMKNSLEDGTFSRGREVISAEGSIVFLGNLDGDVQTIQRSSHLFYPMPKEMDPPDGNVTREELAEYVEFALEMRRRVTEPLKKMGGLEYWDVNFSYTDRNTGAQKSVGLPESGGGLLITGDRLPAGSVYTLGTDPGDHQLALFLIQTPVDRGSGRIAPLGNLSPMMREALTAADAYLKAHIRDLGIDRDPRQYDFTVQAVNLNQAREGAGTAIAFFISMVSALLERPTDPTTVVAGEMSVKGMLQRVASLPERLELAREAGAKRVLIPSENKRDLADVPDEILNRLQPVFYTDPINPAIRAMGLE